MDLSTIAARLKDANRSKISRATGIPVSTLRNLANGLTKRPGFNVVDTLRCHFKAVDRAK